MFRRQVEFVIVKLFALCRFNPHFFLKFGLDLCLGHGLNLGGVFFDGRLVFNLFHGVFQLFNRAFHLLNGFFVGVFGLILEVLFKRKDWHRGGRPRLKKLEGPLPAVAVTLEEI